MPPQEPKNLPTPDQAEPSEGPNNLAPPTEPGGTATGGRPQVQEGTAPLQALPDTAEQSDTSGQSHSQDGQTQSEADEAKAELREAIHDSNEVLATATTVMPLFSDVYTLDRAKVTVSKRTLFGSAEVMSMRVEDVLNAAATVGPFLGSLQLTNRVANQQPYTVGPFWRKDTLRLKRITQGYVIAMQKNIDVSSLSANELEHMLERLGEDDHPATNTDEPSA